MENWPKDLVLGLGVNVAVLALWWLRGLLPSITTTTTSSSSSSSVDRRVARQEDTLDVLGVDVPQADLETAGGVVLAVAVMAAVAAEIAADAGFVRALGAQS